MVLVRPTSGKCWAGFSDLVCTKKREFRSSLGRRDKASATFSKHFHLQTLWLHSCLLVSAPFIQTGHGYTSCQSSSPPEFYRDGRTWSCLHWAFNTCWERSPGCGGSVCHTNAEGGSTSTNTKSGLRETSCYSISDTSHKAEAALILPTRPSGCSLVTCEARWLDRKSLIRFLCTSLFKHEYAEVKTSTYSQKVRNQSFKIVLIWEAELTNAGHKENSKPNSPIYLAEANTWVHNGPACDRAGEKK